MDDLTDEQVAALRQLCLEWIPRPAGFSAGDQMYREFLKRVLGALPALLAEVTRRREWERKLRERIEDRLALLRENFDITEDYAVGGIDELEDLRKWIDKNAG